MNVGPILFSAPMIRALLDGRKTQTRRILKLPKQSNRRGDWQAGTVGGPGVVDGKGRPYAERPCVWHTGTGLSVLPRWSAGDLLWVKESGLLSPAVHSDWGALFRHDVPATQETGFWWVEKKRGTGASYSVAGCSRQAALAGGHVKVRPSIFMPRWASRLTLQITDVRMQRLQDISEADAAAEGAELRSGLDPADFAAGKDLTHARPNYRFGFYCVWQAIHPMGSPGAWSVNPWIVALTVIIHKSNVDELLKQRGAA